MGVMEVQPCAKLMQVDSQAAMRFQERDGAILQAIYSYDGVLARRHLKAMFWPDAGARAMEMRLSALYHQGYLNWPSAFQRRTQPIPEAICWLGWRGALWIAQLRGAEVTPPASLNETQLRTLAAKLRQLGIRWLREPRWSQLVHDLAIVDVRLAFESAVAVIPSLALERWVSEGEFLSQMDVVEFGLRSQDGSLRLMKRGVRPDAYCVILDGERLSQGLPARARLLLELDMATHDTGSFVREKAIAGVAYIRSPSYKSRFGHNSGRWLVVTTSAVRLNHLMQETRQALAVDAVVFWYTTLEQAKAGNVLTSPIWWRAGSDVPVSLFTQVGNSVPSTQSHLQIEVQPG